MKRVFYIVVFVFFFAGCANSLYPEYTLSKKYPQNIPDLDMQILSDTSGVIMHRKDKSIQQGFGFIRKKNHFLVITYVDDTNRLISLSEGDTIVYRKKELYLFNEKQKLVFIKKE
jgi:uncharacterized lipoprotein YajG